MRVFFYWLLALFSSMAFSGIESVGQGLCHLWIFVRKIHSQCLFIVCLLAQAVEHCFVTKWCHVTEWKGDWPEKENSRGPSLRCVSKSLCDLGLSIWKISTSTFSSVEGDWYRSLRMTNEWLMSLFVLL